MVTILIINIKGIPIVNFKCFVLCLNLYIPIYEPIEPKISERKINVFSLIRHLLFLAKYLSYPISKNDIRFITSIYIIKYLNSIKVITIKIISKKRVEHNVYSPNCLLKSIKF